MLLLNIHVDENMMTKGEISHYEQYFFLSHCFQNALESIYMEKRVIPLPLTDYS